MSYFITWQIQSSSKQIAFCRFHYKNIAKILHSERFEASSFVADLISSKISSQHLIDPTLSEFTINTNARGDFNKIINLINFQSQEIIDDDFQFIIEIFD